jgi:hypothetical protein
LRKILPHLLVLLHNLLDPPRGKAARPGMARHLLQIRQANVASKR